VAAFVLFCFFFFGVKICTVAEFWKIYVTNFHDLFFENNGFFFEKFKIQNC
jgi:hypothetical protein